METGQPLADVRDQIVSANAYLGAQPIARGAGDGRRRGRHRPHDRHRAHARPARPPLRVGLGRLGQDGGRAPSPGTSWSAARSPRAATSPTGTTCPTWPGSGSPSPRSPPTARSSSPSTTAPAGWSRAARSPSSSCTRSATRPTTSRPTSSPTLRRSTSRTRATTASASAASAGPRTPSSSRSRPPTRTAGRRPRRSCTPGPSAAKKARSAGEILQRPPRRARPRVRRVPLRDHRRSTRSRREAEADAAREGDLDEVQLRVSVRSQDKAAVEQFGREIAPLILTGPSAVTGFAGGRPRPSEVVAYWPALIPKSEVQTEVRDPRGLTDGLEGGAAPTGGNAGAFERHPFNIVPLDRPRFNRRRSSARYSPIRRSSSPWLTSPAPRHTVGPSRRGRSDQSSRRALDAPSHWHRGRRGGQRRSWASRMVTGARLRRGPDGHPDARDGRH